MSKEEQVKVVEESFKSLIKTFKKINDFKKVKEILNEL